MSYKNAAQILPGELLAEVQRYADGEVLYIPRISEEKRPWGEATSTRRDLTERNRRIYADYLSGETTGALAEKYFLSVKSIQRIVGQFKKE